MSFGTESVFTVESRALLEGLLLAWDKGYRGIEVESDNALLMELLLFGGGANNTLAEVLMLQLVLCR